MRAKAAGLARDVLPLEGMRTILSMLLGAALALSATACDTSLLTNRDERAANGGCEIAGCSSEICVDAGDADKLVSDCSWHESYACYDNAACGRQANGACGWTPTAELDACLADAQ